MAPLGEYLQTWKLKLSTTKTVSAVFHHKEAKRELKVNFSNESLPFYSEPKYLRLGVTLDRSLTYRRHLESLRKKLTSRVVLSRRLTGSGAGPPTLQIATLALVHSAAEYCSTVWCRGAHTRLLTPPSTTPCELWLDPCVLHQRTTFPSSQTSNQLSFVAGVTLSPARRPMEPGPVHPSANLKSRHLFVPAAQFIWQQ